MAMELEMLRSFSNNCELLCYITNTIKNWLKLSKTELFYHRIPSVLTLMSVFVEGGRGEGGLLEREGLLKISIYRREAY